MARTLCEGNGNAVRLNSLLGELQIGTTNAPLDSGLTVCEELMALQLRPAALRPDPRADLPFTIGAVPPCRSSIYVIA